MSLPCFQSRPLGTRPGLRFPASRPPSRRRPFQPIDHLPLPSCAPPCRCPPSCPRIPADPVREFASRACPSFVHLRAPSRRVQVSPAVSLGPSSRWIGEDPPPPSRRLSTSLKLSSACAPSIASLVLIDFAWSGLQPRPRRACPLACRRGDPGVRDLLGLFFSFAYLRFLSIDSVNVSPRLGGRSPRLRAHVRDQLH